MIYEKCGKKYIIIAIIVVGLLSGGMLGYMNFKDTLFSKKIDLSYIKTPDAIIMMGNQHKTEINKLQSQIKELQGKPGTENELAQTSSKLKEIASKDTVRTYDKNVIEQFFTAIQKSKGTIEKNTKKPEGERIIAMQFGYDNGVEQTTSDGMVNNIKLGYLANLYILPNNIVLLPIYDEKVSGKISTVKVVVNKEAIDNIDEFYSSSLKGN